MKTDFQQPDYALPEPEPAIAVSGGYAFVAVPDNVQLAIYAREGAKFGNLGKMCGSCAFRLDSAANLEPHNVEAAKDCLAYEMTFNCHAEIGVDKGCKCVGFLYAKQYFENKTSGRSDKTQL